METDFRPRIPRDVFEGQIAMFRDGICSGSIDGAWGRQTQTAVIAYQQKHGLRVTAQLDNATRERLQLQEPPLTTYTIQAGDFARLRPLPKGWLARSEIDRLDYSTILELVAEKHAANPNKIRQLNPHVTNWDAVNAGTVVAVPNVTRQPLPRPVALIVIHLTNKTLEAFDSDSRLLVHFPCSIARRVEKRPVGRLEVQVTAENPNYTFNPDTFPESEEARRIGRKLILQPGPNNPVGLAWIDLNLDGYGIHGSPDPEMIGRTESSGCFRLANWNATFLLRYAVPGLPVQVEP
jgi:lipoprotein-anchoring transpeptidase ErfK/SrfK